MRSPARWLVICLVVSLILTIGVAPALAQDTTHIVQPGDNMFRIALQYGVSVDALAAANGIVNSWYITPGQTLVIPGLEPVEPIEPVGAATTDLPIVLTIPREVNANAPVAQFHIVARGENLMSIAQRYGLTPDELVELNHLGNADLIYAGQQLQVSYGSLPPVASDTPPASPELVADVLSAQPGAAPVQTTYTVQPGDHVASIAMRYGVTWNAIVTANALPNADHIEVGQTLIIPDASADPSAVAAEVAADLGILSSVPEAPAAAIPHGRSIVVDLSDSRIYAYEDGVLVRNVLASTGLPATPTVQGDYSIYVKYPAQLMAGPGYYLPDVPYVMYFYEGYGIHGTYWHNNFGNPMSHGCVNLPTPEAEWFYNFASVGTPVRVQA